MLSQRRHLILLYPLLLVPFLTRSQQRLRDTVILHFKFDSYQIQPADRARLAATPAGNIDSITIIGYTDKTGSVAYNERLSQQRADAAARLLGASRSHPIGGGIAPTPERTDSDNRRVEIVYYSKLPIPPTTTNTNPVPHYDTVTRRDPNPNPDPAPARPTDSIVVIKNAPPDSSNPADSARPETVLALHRINFIVDTPIPTDSTRSILPQFVSELERFRDHHLEIDGYVNSLAPLRGAKDPLFILSVHRAKFIYDYLVNAGFDPAKLSYKGMGNASPINPHPVTRQEMDANMRVEIRVY
jgi:outer membrane protein OmpA-like peptidoglycan-associated protein